MADLSGKFRVDRTSAPGLTMLSLHGIIDASLEGVKLAGTVKTSKLVLDLSEVRRFASWGMAEWMNFLGAAQELDVYFVECSVYALQQMSQVTGLLGHGKLVSFYAPFRCGSCGEEQATLVVVAQSPERLLELTESARPCPTCGGTARMSKYQADSATSIASNAGYDIDDEVAAFLRAHLKYEIAPNLAKFRASRRKQGRNTYLRLSGNLATLPAAKLARAVDETTMVDMSRVIFDPAQLAPWREFVRAAASNVDTLQLLDCPAGFFDRAVTAEDLGSPKLKIRSFVQAYTCPKCSTQTTAMIDVAQQLEELTAGTLPSQRCASCKFEIPGPVSEGPLQRLPARERDVEQDRFLDKAKQEPDDKLENALALRGAKAKPTAVTTRSVFIGSALAALLVGGLVLAVLFVWRKDSPAVVTQPTTRDNTPTFQRPEWLLSDTPSSAFCQEMIGRQMCVGVSAYSNDREAAVLAANDAALDELVNLLGIKIDDVWFRDNVLPGYSGARTKALAAMQNLGPRADDSSIRTVRHKVAELFLASGGPAVPAQRSDWYWEEYERGSGQGTEFLVFVRYDVSAEALSLLVKRYAVAVPLKGSAAITSFPGLAWQDPSFAGGVMLSKVGGPLAAAGAAPLQVVTEIDGQPVVDATTIANQLIETGSAAELVLTARNLGDAAPTKLTVKR